MHYRFEDLIAYVSQSETLHSGEILGSGTVGSGSGLEALRFLQPGERVALVGANRAAYAEVLFGAWQAGLAVVPINWRLHPAEIAYILDDCDAALCVCDASLRGALASQAAADDLAWLFYTSGATGRPKGVLLTHRDSTLAHLAPLSHGSGMYLLAFIAAGAANLIPRCTTFASDDLVESLNRHRRISMFMAPMMVRRLLEHPDMDFLQRERIELIIYGGGPMLLVQHRRGGRAAALGRALLGRWGLGARLGLAAQRRA